MWKAGQRGGGGAKRRRQCCHWAVDSAATHRNAANNHFASPLYRSSENVPLHCALTNDYNIPATLVLEIITARYKFQMQKYVDNFTRFHRYHAAGERLCYVGTYVAVSSPALAGAHENKFSKWRWHSTLPLRAPGTRLRDVAAPLALSNLVVKFFFWCAARRSFSPLETWKRLTLFYR